ncbi:nucleoside-diphosphate-sugar epimerase [Runella defluvii]|uniref:Nucleoside-diphosphate-sugar epimerase n=1 Tax=Runella defluvii TaxID=370973 RepID=A0A7W6EU77_9BACT|nr:aldehyde reductase [Runella defluvii]MBB3842116.1 nucleoside-diphosphate-sugar epimerase [Runella defluvii]
MKKVLVTGITGFLGSHTAIQLLEKGYEVVGTLRSLQRADAIKAVIGQHTANTHLLSFAEADLSNEKVWMLLTKEMDYVQHIASPFPRELPKNDEELIEPAKNGVLNILKAASKNGVKRVVLTSSSSAILYGRAKNDKNVVLDENTWTDVSNLADTTPYFRSKTIAEKAAWEYIKTDKSGLELTTVLPGAILGPVLEEDFGTSANIVIKALDGTMPALPAIGFDMVDVRSVAELLILAMEKPQAAHQRYAGSAGFISFKEVAQLLKTAYPRRRIPSFLLPNFVVQLFSLFDKTLQPILVDLGVERKINNSKAINELGWRPRTNREAVLACAESVLKLGIVQ